MKKFKKLITCTALCCLVATMLPVNAFAATEKTGTVSVNSWLNVRTAPNTNSEIAKKLNNGDKVTIVEEQTIGGMQWGRCQDGWVATKYINFGSGSANNPAPAKTGTGYVRVIHWLNVRENPGMNEKIVDKLYNSTKINVTETKQVDGRNWGKMDQGWVALDYVDFGSLGIKHVSTRGSKLNIRTGPGTNFESVGGLDNGAEVNIVELSPNKDWGRIGTNQWISMHYVK